MHFKGEQNWMHFFKTALFKLTYIPIFKLKEGFLVLLLL